MRVWFGGSPDGAKGTSVTETTEKSVYPKSPPQVRSLFNALAPRYDFLNHLFSMGLDFTWRRRAVRALAPDVPGPLLDAATGSADLAIALARRYADRAVTGVDFSPAMLDRARDKVRAAGLSTRVALEVGDVTALPYEAGTFAGATIAFGIRNVPDRALALSELTRVLRSGGRLAVLELSIPTAPVFAPVYLWYFRRVMPAAASIVRQGPVFRYLFESVRAFPEPERFRAMMSAAGLGDVAVRPLTLGAARLYVGTKP